MTAAIEKARILATQLSIKSEICEHREVRYECVHVTLKEMKI